MNLKSTKKHPSIYASFMIQTSDLTRTIPILFRDILCSDLCSKINPLVIVYYNFRFYFLILVSIISRTGFSLNVQHIIVIWTEMHERRFSPPAGRTILQVNIYCTPFCGIFKRPFLLFSFYPISEVFCSLFLY